MAAEVALVASRLREAAEGDADAVDLSGCKLAALPQAVTLMLKDVVILRCDLSNNLLTSLSSKINALQHLQVLNISHNRLKTLPQALALPHLEELDVSHNELAAVPPVVFGLATLRCLRANDNGIAAVDAAAFAALPELHTLEIERNPVDPAVVRNIASQLALPAAHRRF